MVFGWVVQPDRLLVSRCLAGKCTHFGNKLLLMSVNGADFDLFLVLNWQPAFNPRSFWPDTQTTGYTMATRTKKRSSTAKTTTRKTPTSASAKTDLATETEISVAVNAEPSAAITTPEVVVIEPHVVAAELPMRKKELIDLVVERSGIKKKDAKPVIEAMLAVLGETIGGGRELNLQPLGKLRINRSVERNNGRITICKLRQSVAISGQSLQADEFASAPLAEDDG